MSVSYSKLLEYVVTHPNIRTLLVEPKTFVELLNLMNKKSFETDASGEFIRLHWAIIRPNVGFDTADEFALREKVA